MDCLLIDGRGHIAESLPGTLLLTDENGDVQVDAATRARRATDISYWGSQAFPPGGSLMLAVTAQTPDEHPQGDADGELAETYWVDVGLLPTFPLAPPGSIARDMMNSWYFNRTGKELHGH